MTHLLTIFCAVFVAELGDKTQLATLLFASDGEHAPGRVFLAAAAALVASTILAVAVGTLADRWLEVIPLKLVSGLGFIAIGVWTVWEYWRG